jgi:hypothetical protein
LIAKPLGDEEKIHYGTSNPRRIPHAKLLHFAPTINAACDG